MNHQLAQFLEIVFALGVVTTVAHTVGRLVQLVGQPKVVGEMVAGVVLGPSLLGAIAPEWSARTFGPEERNAIFLLSQLGLSGYMFLVGCELDMTLFTPKAMRRATTLALTGMLPSMIIGGTFAIMFYGQLATGFRAVGVWEFAFYMGSALAITAFPMLARILEENRLAASPMGALTILAASVDDAVAWCLLALIVALAKSESVLNGLLPIIGGIGFFAVCFLVVRPLLGFVARAAERRGAMSQEEFALTLVLLLAAIWITDYIGIYSVFGGFALGVCMPRSPMMLREIRSHMYQFIVVFFLPMFFANSGLNTNIVAVVSGGLLIPLIVIVSASFVAKYGFCTIAMRRLGFSWRESSAMGGLFNARGLMLLIFANIGVAHGLINGDVYTMLVIVAVVTTAAAMPIFRMSIKETAEPKRTELGEAIA